MGQTFREIDWFQEYDFNKIEVLRSSWLVNLI